MTLIPFHSPSRARLGRTPLRCAAAGLAALLATAASAGTLGVFTSPEAGFDTHTFYYDDGQEVVVFDTQFVPQLTQAMVSKIRSETRSPITKVVVTHPNPDKFNGLAVLHGLGAMSITSAAVAADMPPVHAYKQNFFVNVAKTFKADTYPKFEPVKQTFSGPSTRLKLASGETITLFALKHAGVASHQVVARIDGTGDLIVGDLLQHNAHAWLEGGIVNGKPAPDLEAWVSALGELPALAAGHPDAKVYGGRGEFVPVRVAVPAQQAYLRDALSITRAAVRGDGKACDSPEASPATMSTVEKKLAEAYPHYKLPYIVHYSVYGLVGQVQRIACATSSR